MVSEAEAERILDAAGYRFELETIELLGDAAREAALPFFRLRGLSLENKDGASFDPVTEADRAVELAMRDILAERHPQDGVLGEEFGEVMGASGRVWVLDPIDGTRSFMSGMPCWGVLAALYDASGAARRPVLGLIDQPYIGERFIGLSAAEGMGWARLTTRFGAQPLDTRACADLDEATLFCTDMAIFESAAERAAFEAVSGAARLTRFGTDCYGYAMVAAGCADLVIESGLKPYDVQALIPVIEGAGGVVTDWSGGAAHWGGQVVAAGDPAVHAQALQLLARAARSSQPEF